MSEAFLPTRKIEFSDLRRRVWEPPLSWRPNPPPVGSIPPDRMAVVTDGAGYVHCYDAIADELPNSATFEIYGSGRLGAQNGVLWAIAQQFDVVLVSEYWRIVFTPDEVIADLRTRPSAWLDQISRGVATYKPSWGAKT